MFGPESKFYKILTVFIEIVAINFAFIFAALGYFTIPLAVPFYCRLMSNATASRSLLSFPKFTRWLALRYIASVLIGYCLLYAIDALLFFDDAFIGLLLVAFLIAFWLLSAILLFDYKKSPLETFRLSFFFAAAKLPKTVVPIFLFLEFLRFFYGLLRIYSALLVFFALSYLWFRLITRDIKKLLGDNMANIRVFETTDEKNMFKEKHITENGGETVTIDITKEFQRIDGYGASFTDSSSYLINQKLDKPTRDALMEKLFGQDCGIGLSFTRTPMGSSDFARDYYSFDDMPDGETDEELKHFSIARDLENTIPLLKQAISLNPDLKIIASPWSPPGWMKTSGHMLGGTLKPEYYAVYAKYFARYIEEYNKEGIEIYAITPQNEPLYIPETYAGCGMSPQEQADFITNHLRPLFTKLGIKTKILCFDHNWNEEWYPKELLKLAAPDIDGVAWHWYGGDIKVQSDIYHEFPGKEVHLTEASGGEWIPPFTEAFMAFLTKGIDIMNNYSQSWVLWNFALDENNGPIVPQFSTDGRSTCRGVVYINSQNGELRYNLDYYALAHFSKFIRPGAVRIYSKPPKDIHVLACKNPDGLVVIVAANDKNSEKLTRFKGEGFDFSYKLMPKSAATFVVEGRP